MPPFDGLIDFCFLSAGLLIATVIRLKVGFIQKLLIPNNIIAGFFCFAVGSSALGIVDIDYDRYGNYVYHLLAVTFISIALRGGQGKRNFYVVSTGFILTLGIAVQTAVGLAIGFCFAVTLFPNIFPTFGYYLMLGFSQGPGQSYALGKTWEPLGLEHGGNLGLTFAAIGFLWACFAGVAMVHFALRKHGQTLKERIAELPRSLRTGVYQADEEPESAGRLTTSSAAIDSLAFHLSMVGIIYGVTFCLLWLVDRILLSGQPSQMLHHLVNTMWGLHFVFAAWLAFVTRLLFDRFGKGHLLNDSLLTRISGTSLDYMVCAAIAAISFAVFVHYAIPIIVMTTIGGIITIFLVRFAVRRSSMSHQFERELSIFGTLTGTLSTGLTLLRIIDPNFKSPAPSALVFATAVTLPLSLPIIVSSFIPIHYWQGGQTQLMIYGPVLALTALYAIALYLVWRYLITRKVKRQ